MQKAQEVYNARKDYFLSTLKRLGPLVGQKVSTPDGEGTLLAVSPKDFEGFPFVAPRVDCAVWFEGVDEQDLPDALSGQEKLVQCDARDVQEIPTPLRDVTLGVALRIAEANVPRMTADNCSEFVSAVADHLRRSGLQSIHITSEAVANVDIDVAGLKAENKMLNSDIDSLIKSIQNTVQAGRKAHDGIKDRLKSDAQNAPFRTS